MMKFSEFEKQCLENFKFNEGTLCWDETWIDGLCLSVDRLDGSYEIETYSEYFDEQKGESIYSHQVVIGNYVTLRRAYNALVKICILNNKEI